MGRKPTSLAFVVALAMSQGAPWAAPHAHEHGAVKLDVAIDGNTLSIGLEAPLESLLGFERAPRTDPERRMADALLARLRAGAALFSADAAAHCTLSKAEVHAPVLQAGARAAGGDEHADLDAGYEFRCAQPQLLRTLDVGLFDAFRRIQRIDVQVAGPKAQTKATLKRPTRTVKLVR